MRIVFVTLGSRGDLQPFVAFGAVLKGRGHEVRIAAQAEFEPLIRSANLEHHPLPGSITKVVEPLVTSSSLRIMRAIMASLEVDAAELADSTLVACEGADFVVVNAISHTFAWEKLGVPWCTAYLQPVTATSAFPAVGFPSLPLGGLYNRLTYATAPNSRLGWQGLRPFINACRERLGLPRFGSASPFGDFGTTRPVLYGYSASAIPRPGDWPEQCHVTGYWFLDRHWEPTSELADFVADGPPPLAVVFGSTWSRNPDERSRTVVVDAARRAGRLLIVIGGTVQDEHGDVLCVDDVDYQWLLPQTAAVIHHGGAGTTAAALRAGVPQVVVPYNMDNPFWAERMYRLGVSTAPVPFRRLTASRLFAAIETATTSGRIRDRVDETGERIRAERGVETASDLVEQFVSRPG